MDLTYNALLQQATQRYLDSIDVRNQPSPEKVESELLEVTNEAIDAYNLGPEDDSAPPGAPMKVRFPAQRPTSERIRKLRRLEPSQVAACMTKLDGACRIAPTGLNGDPDYDLVAVYQKDGDNKGIYVTSEDELRKIARSYNYTMSSKEFDEIMIALRDMAPRRARCSDRDLIAVNNGIFDYKTKLLMDFDPELVFMTKSHVDYVDNAQNPVIHNNDDGTDWDVVSWMSELSDDPEIVHLLWEILGAIIRPNVSWNKSAWLFSETGNNGKGTLCALMRNLCGAGAYASIPLKDFSKDFMLEPLTRASAIIVDENDVGTYIDQAANLKAVITNDVISINRKFKTPVAYQFWGFMVQCMNEFPRVKDRSDSFYRRQLFIPMTKSFEGHERKYIKDDYLARSEVLQYVLFHVLHDTNYYSLSEPQACRDVLTEYKSFNDPVRQFFEELEGSAVWKLLPYAFLYDLYTQWFKENQPSGTIIGKTPFLREIRQLAQKSKVFYIAPGDPSVRADNRMDYPEPLIYEYGLSKWMDKSYRGANPDRISSPYVHGKTYRGLQRYDDATLPSQPNDDENDTDSSDTEKGENNE